MNHPIVSERENPCVMLHGVEETEILAVRPTEDAEAVKEFKHFSYLRVFLLPRLPAEQIHVSSI